MTLQERIAAAKAAMKKIHAGLQMAVDGGNEFKVLDTPNNVADLDPRDARALRREL